MGKKQGMQKRPVHKPSAISSGEKRIGKAAAYEMLNAQEKAIVAALPPKVQIYLEASGFERGFRTNQRISEGFAQVEQNITRLIRRCDYVDVAAATLEGKELKDMLGGGLAAAIQADYETIAQEWDQINKALIRMELRPQPDFSDTHTNIHSIVNERLAALKALADGDDTLIQSLKLLDHEMRDLLNRVKRKGRKGGGLDWLRGRWLEYEAEHPHTLPAQVKAGLIDELATWDLSSKSYVPKDNLTADQLTAFNSLVGSKTNASNFRYNLIERKAVS